MKNENSQSLELDLDNINVYAEVYQYIPLSSRDKAIFIFFRIWRSAKPRPMINVILQESHFFQNLNLGKNWTNLKCHLTISWGTSCQYQCVCKISSHYSTQFIEIAPLSLFQNLELGKASTNKKCHLQSLGLDVVNINVYATVYQNIPLSLRDRVIFTFSEFGARQSLDR